MTPRRRADPDDLWADTPIVDLETEEESINVLVLGESGSGKTPFAGSASRGLLIATEKGTISAQRRGSKMKLWKCPTWADFVKAKDKLQLAAERPGGIKAHFDWVSIDSGTSAQTLLLRSILEEETKSEPTKRQGEKGLDLPQIQDHQLWQNRFKRYIAEMVDLPVNLCVTALPMNVETTTPEGDIEENVLPQFLGQKGAIAWHIAGMFSAGGRVTLRKKKVGERTKTYQRIYWQKNGAYWGRDRYEALAPYTDDLTLDELAERVAKSGKD